MKESVLFLIVLMVLKMMGYFFFLFSFFLVFLSKKKKWVSYLSSFSLSLRRDMEEDVTQVKGQDM